MCPWHDVKPLPSLSGRKKSKLKSLKTRLFRRSKRADGEANTKLSQSASDITAGKGLGSDEDLWVSTQFTPQYPVCSDLFYSFTVNLCCCRCSQGMMGSRAFSHDSIFLADEVLADTEPVRVLSQENVNSKIKALQVTVYSGFILNLSVICWLKQYFGVTDETSAAEDASGTASSCSANQTTRRPLGGGRRSSQPIWDLSWWHDPGNPQQGDLQSYICDSWSDVGLFYSFNVFILWGELLRTQQHQFSVKYEVMLPTFLFFFLTNIWYLKSGHKYMLSRTCDVL